MQSTAPTMKSIARLAGVSRMTVSRALRNDPLLSRDTKRKIHHIADELGYRPDPRVSELMSHLRKQHTHKTSEVIAHVYFTDTGNYDAAAGSPNACIVDGAARAADRAGYRLESFWCCLQECSVARMAEILHARGIRGAIIRNETEGADVSAMTERLASVELGMPTLKSNLHRVAFNHHFATGLGLEKLVASGYQRIGLYVASTANAYRKQTWRCAFLAHQFEQATLAPELACIVDRAEPIQFRRWFESVRPDAVIATHGEVIRWVEETRLSIPDEVGFVHLNWSPEFGTCAGVKQRWDTVGAVAIDLVHHQLLNNLVGPPEHPIVSLVNGDWIDGDSIRLPQSMALKVRSA